LQKEKKDYSCQISIFDSQKEKKDFSCQIWYDLVNEFKIIKVAFSFGWFGCE
jgi:hypothetical protein